MKFTLKILTIMVMAASVFAGHSVQAGAVVGEMAPAFGLSDVEGHTVVLGDLKGKRVVLEWTNAQCPFVKKHYGTHNMQDTQKKATDDGVIWISVISSAEGKQGQVSAAQAKEIVVEKGAHPTHVILDPEGTLGHLYGAVTTPHMFVIDTAGRLAYAGAIDDRSSPNPSTVEGAHNYVLAALDDLAQGRVVVDAQTQPYGCGVKY